MREMAQINILSPPTENVTPQSQIFEWTVQNINSEESFLFHITNQIWKF